MLTQPLQRPFTFVRVAASAAPAAVPLNNDREASSRCGWLDLLCLTLLGYALFGKGWAYVGVPPLFIGDALLVVGVLWLLLLTPVLGVVLSSPPMWLVLLLMGWGCARTWPYLGRYRIDALRDAVIWGYAAFAPIVFGLVVARPDRLAVLFRLYSVFAKVFVASVPVVWLGLRFGGAAIPRWPWADVPVVHAKGGDLLVHLAGVIAFWAVGTAPVRPFWLLMLACNVGLIGAYNRGGLIAFLLVLAICGLFRPLAGPLWRLGALVTVALLLLALTDLRVRMPGKGREVSFSQLTDNVFSVVGDSEEQDLDGTKQWRLRWWGDIADYTLFGRHFWGGKGFGVNLADDDGYQGTAWEGQLRSPHNGHVTMLARAGVPGLALWLLVHLAWAAQVVNRYYQAKAAGRRTWQGAFLFLLAYWAAFMANASFDVFIEGPMGGIWLWTVYGVGLAAAWAYRHHPEILNDRLEQVASDPTRR